MTDKEKIVDLESRVKELEDLTQNVITLFKTFGGAKAKIYLAALKIAG